MSLLAGAVLPKLCAKHAKMSGLCHWSCPQTLASATPLGESARSISHVTVSADASLNDCGNAPGWYYFPGTRLAIQDVDGVIPVNRCGAERGMMHMLYKSELPALGAAKASVAVCMAACQRAASLRQRRASAAEAEAARLTMTQRMLFEPQAHEDRAAQAVHPLELSR